MKRQETVNTFSDGLNMDLHPLSMPDNALTNCLNGTLLSNNGNEGTLLNDMGNCRIETAMLPSGYIPLGSTSFGGIIYILSYNPIEDKCLIGSFPSPERNLTKTEMGDDTKATIDFKDFCEGDWYGFDKGNDDYAPNIITKYKIKTNLLKSKLFSGDKFKVYSEDIKKLLDFNKKIISGYDEDNKDSDKFPRYIKFDIVSTLDNGKTIYLTNDAVWSYESNDKYYYIKPIKLELEDNNIDLEEYRSLVQSNYDTYSSKYSGKLGIEAKLEVPISFSVGYDAVVKGLDKNKDADKLALFYFYLNWENENVGEHKSWINPMAIKIELLGYDTEGNLTNNTIVIKNSEGKSIFPLCLPTKELHPKCVTEVDASIIDNYLFAGFDIPSYEDETTKQTYCLYDDDFDKEKYFEFKENICQSPANYARRNDGTDISYLMKGPLLYGSSLEGSLWAIANNQTSTIISNSNNIATFKVTPIMPFGELKFLERTITVNLDKLGTGEINLKNYLYYVDDKEVNLDFYLEAYLSSNEIIRGVGIKFIPISTSILSGDFLKQSTYEEIDNSKQFANSHTIENRTYELNSDIATDDTILITSEGNIQGVKHLTIDKKYFENNSIYLVLLVLDISGKPKIFYRLFFNCPIFNTAYGTGIDFNSIYLYEPDVDYGLKPTLQLEGKINSSVSNLTLLNGENIPNLGSTSLYLLAPDVLNIEHVFLVKHDINNTFKLLTGYEDNITLSNISASAKKDNTVEYVAEESLPEDTIFNNLTNINVNVNGSNISFKNEFNVKVPIKLSYNRSETFPSYNLELLKNSDEDIKLLHWTEKEEEEGGLRLFINDEKIWEYKHPDYTNSDKKPYNEIVPMIAITSYLKQYMNLHSYDYITLFFGLESIKDNNWGYTHTIFDADGTKRLTAAFGSQGKAKSLPKKLSKSFVRINCFRDQESSILISKLANSSHGSSSDIDKRAEETVLSSTLPLREDFTSDYVLPIFSKQFSDNPEDTEEESENKYTSDTEPEMSGNLYKIENNSELHIILNNTIDLSPSGDDVLEPYNWFHFEILHQIPSGKPTVTVWLYSDDEDEPNDDTVKLELKAYNDWGYYDINLLEAFKKINKTKVKEIIFKLSESYGAWFINNIYFYKGEIEEHMQSDSNELNKVMKNPSYLQWWDKSTNQPNVKPLDLTLVSPENPLYKYVRQSRPLDLYFIDSIECVLDPNITTTYNINLNINNVSLNINGTSIQQSDELVHNLSLAKFKETSVQLIINSIIKNSSWVKQLYLLKTYAGWNDSRGLLTDDKLTQVLLPDSSISQYLTIDENGLAEAARTNYLKHNVDIEWEDTKCDNRYKPLEDSVQGYSIESLYSPR